MARAQGARAQMALAYETVYGTPPVSGFRLMPFARTTLGSEQPLLESELLGYGRDPLAPIKDAVTADGEVVIPIDVEAFGFWLKAAFGQPVTSGTTPKTHTFQSGNWTLPSIAIETAMPEVPRFAMYSGCVLDQLTWQMQRSGLLTATARLVAQGETIAAATAAGTPTALSLQRFGHFNGTVKRNGSALGNVVSAEITYSNNLDRIETIRGDGRIDGADPAMAALSGRIEVRFSDTTLITQAIDGTPCELEFNYSLGANASFTFTAHAVYLPRPRIEIAGPQGLQATFDWMAAKAIGGFIGSTIGSVVDNWIVSSLAPAQRIEGTRLDSLRITSSTEGAVIPRLFGRMRIGGNIIWATDFREVVNTTSQGGGKGSGPKVTTTEYLYYASFAVALCEGEITGIGRVWADGKAMDLTGITWRWYPGDEVQFPDPFISAKMGAASTPAYRGTAYVVFEELNLSAFGNRLPQISFEVFRPLADPDTAEGLVKAVTMIPASGEFTYATAPVKKTTGSGGTTVAENLNAITDTADIVVALDRLQSLAPAVESVSLVVAWFGDDLRAGNCKVRPGVEVAAKTTTPSA